MKRIFSLILVVSILIACTSCSTKKAENKPYSASFFAFDTDCTIKIYDKKPVKKLKSITNKIIKKCNELDTMYDTNENSYWKEKDSGHDSIIYKEGDHDYSEKGSHKCFAEAEEDCVWYATEYSKHTNGAFDITLEPVIKLWNIGTHYFKIPTYAQIKEKLKLVDYKQINDDPGNYYILTKNGSLDFGGIAKGYAADQIVNMLEYNKIKTAIIDLGGNIYAYGTKNGKPFKVGIEKPFGKGKLSATVNAKNTSVVTAGIYQRYSKYKGKIYPHIIDPKTGYPIDNDLNSVTIISKEATAADAYSTACMVMGLNKGMKFVNKTKNIEAVFIDKDNKLHLSKGLEKKGDEINIK